MLFGLVSTSSGRCSALLAAVAYCCDVTRANCVQTQHVHPWYPSVSTMSCSPSVTRIRNSSRRHEARRPCLHRQTSLQMNCKATSITIRYQRWRTCWLYSCTHPLHFHRQTRVSSLSTHSQPCSITRTPAIQTIGRRGPKPTRRDGPQDANLQL